MDQYPITYCSGSRAGWLMDCYIICWFVPAWDYVNNKDELTSNWYALVPNNCTRIWGDMQPTPDVDGHYAYCCHNKLQATKTTRLCWQAIVASQALPTVYLYVGIT